MNVSGIFKILIIVVACIIVGGVLLNVLLPNGLNSIINWMEAGVKAATGADFDLNGDNQTGGQGMLANDDALGGNTGANVTGYDNGNFVTSAP